MMYGKTVLHLGEEIAKAWAGHDPFAMACQQQGKVYRELEGRRVVRFSLNEKYYFIKLHQGVGWGEVAKNLLQCRLPVISAANEWHALEKIHRLGLHTMTAVAYGRRGINPAKQLSFLITRELPNTNSLAGICAKWPHLPPHSRLKRSIIRQVAIIARTLHENGINHRDFYLHHIHVDIPTGAENLTAENLRLYVIDLHRAQIRRKTPTYWAVKDLGAICFSASDIALTSRDILRFMKEYRRYSSIRQLVADRPFWLKVQRKAKRIARHHYRMKG